MNCGIRVRLYAMPDALKQDIARMCELWNEGLSRFGGPFLAGEKFTAADAFFAPVAFREQTYGLSFDATAAAYAQSLRNLPSMREWYAVGLAETFRDHEHDEEGFKAGVVTEDLRAKA